MIPILLTATVNPKGMQNAQFSVEERAQQYIDAIRFFLDAIPSQRIVFAENSDSISVVSSYFLNEERVEWVNASSLDVPYEYDQNRGKGYNEWLLMHYAITHSATITAAGCFFKITGRLKMLNIASMLRECERRDTNLQFLADCKDHEVYRWLGMKINAHSGECRYFFSSIDFFEREIFPGYILLYDGVMGTHEEKQHDAFLAEDLMYQICCRSRILQHCYDRFRTQARLSGKGGHSLGEGASFFHSTDNDSLVLRFKCSIRQALRYVLPWWKV